MFFVFAVGYMCVYVHLGVWMRGMGKKEFAWCEGVSKRSLCIFA